ncbi:glycosyltransferase family 2 protein [Aliigemmobacter aestuarii]|uniref:Glycosyltransferase family 2 protein n=1 Tax=Aliigemmobacter aestuarii TaxID=1445661 RepID=A0A4S3MQS5_9RHOB|nr:glycosyltransferase family 2 protein [Gemmobacter aestuarii]THD84818.1 glycosyltransferase family 2 protein [Gemmobacter aestuarii]
MRNEGPFIVEWVTWYRLLGFTDILVVTNDCTDPSPDLLDALARAGWVHHLRCDVPPGQPITRRKLRAAKAHPAVTGADWVMVADVDEFLVIHRGEGRITDLIPPGPPAFLGMSINWKVFGSSGIETYADQPVHHQFLQCQRPRHAMGRWVKAIFRRPDWFGRLGEHGPRRFDIAAAGGDWDTPGLGWITADGRPMPGFRAEAGGPRTLPAGLVGHKVAQINHYMLRSHESFGLKRGTLSPVALRDRYDDAYFARADRNEAMDITALRHADAFEALRQDCLRLPDVWRLHHLCCADHVARIVARAGGRPEDDPRHAAHLQKAQGAPEFPED